MKASTDQFTEDKSDLKNQEAALKVALIASEIRYRRLFESAKDGILILDALTGMIMDVNPFLIELLGYSRENLIEKEVWELGFFRDIAANKMKFIELQQKEFVRYDNLPLETNDGRKINVEFVSNVYLVNKKRVIQCNIRDITKRKQAEDALKISETHLHTLVQSIPDLIWVKDTNGKYLSCNAMFTRFFGASEEEIIGKTDYDFVDSELADFFRANDRNAIAAQKPVSNEEWITFADDGHRAYLETIKAPMFDAQHKLIGILGIGRDITERQLAGYELLEAKGKAEESNRLKSAFLANMSHEIRTPMNGILGFTELLKEPHLSDDQQQKYIGIIQKSGDRMLNIINDIISISKVESGQMEVYITDTNVNEQIKDIFNFFEQEAEQKKLQLSYKNSLSFDRAIIKTDREKVFAILANLVKNAIKFTNSGSVEFGYTLNTLAPMPQHSNYPINPLNRPKELVFYVKDTGVGIPSAQKELIFERFRQGSESLNRNYEGAGLGLAISKAYVEMLGGKIWLNDNPEQPMSSVIEGEKGSTFFFTIPYNTEEAEKLTRKLQIQEKSSGNNVRKLKILIVENDETSTELLTIIIRKISKETILTRTGLEAVEICRNHTDIDLILMDIKMPGMDGYEATKLIRTFNKHVIIIAQTAFGLKGDKAKAIDAGCDDYIAKPIKPELLHKLIDKHFTATDVNKSIVSELN